MTPSVQRGALNAVDASGRCVTLDLKLHPSPTTPTESGVTRVDTARAVTEEPQAVGRSADTVGLLVQDVVAWISFQARRRDRRPISGDDAAKPKRGAGASSKPCLWDKVLGAIACLDFVVGGALPVSVQLGFRRSAAARAERVGVRVLFGNPGSRPSRGSGAAEDSTVLLVAAMLRERLQMIYNRAEVSASFEALSVSKLSGVPPELLLEVRREGGLDV